jgi:hypothetical protein
MRYTWLVFILTAALVNSCADPQHRAAPVTNEPVNKATVQNKPPASFSDTAKPGYPSAVFYYPDDAQLEKIKAVTDSMIFKSLVHESFYQMRNARRVLEKYYPLARILEVKNARYLLFTNAAQKKECIDLDTKNDAYGLFIFDGKKAPRLVDMTNIETEAGFYFTK